MNNNKILNRTFLNLIQKLSVIGTDWSYSKKLDKISHDE